MRASALLRVLYHPDCSGAGDVGRAGDLAARFRFLLCHSDDAPLC